MYEFLFIGPLLVLFLILLYHSLKIGGKKETLRFFGIAFIFSFFRELIIGSTYPLYFGSYRVEIGPITLSPAIIFGWIFAFYLAHYFVQTLTTNTGVESHLLVKITLGAFVVLGISLVMETTAPLLGWWSWKTGLLESLPAGSLLFGAPIFVFVGWVITGVTFLTIYYLLQEYQFKPKIIFVSIGIFTIIMINFVIGNYNILYNPPIQISLFYNLQFSFVLLILLSIYTKKRYPTSLYENVLLLLLYVFFEFNLISGILVFLLNPFELIYQVIFITMCLLYSGFFLIKIRKIFEIIKKNI